MTAAVAQSLVFSLAPAHGARVSPEKPDRGRGEALPSLAAAGALRERFYAWRGRSGRRYVCSVFCCEEERFVAEVASGVIIGVVRDAGGRARPVWIAPAGAGELSTLRDCARAAGVAEWHVHFCDHPDAFGDLAGSLLH